MLNALNVVNLIIQQKKNVFSVPHHLYLVLSISDQNPGVMGSNPGKVKEFFFTFHGPHFLTSSGNTEKKIKWFPSTTKIHTADFILWFLY